MALKSSSLNTTVFGLLWSVWGADHLSNHYNFIGLKDD